MARKMPRDLYECYLMHQKALVEQLLDLSTIIATERGRRLFRRQNKPMPEREFWNTVAKMKPKKRAEFETRLYKTPEQRFREEMQAAEKALHEFETDPKVRRRVAREVEVVMTKALKP